MYKNNPAENTDLDTIINSLSKDIVKPEDEVENNVEQSSSQAGTETNKQDVSETKAYSERLNKDRERIRNEERNTIAKSFGFDSWDTFAQSQNNKLMTENGLDPDTVNPIIEKLLENNPKYQDALRYKKEKEELEMKIWAKDELTKLNNKFGTSYNSVDELGEDVVKAWNGGLDLQRAYAAYNYDSIAEHAKKTVIATGGKDHMKSATSGSVTVTPSKQIDSATMYWMKQINPNMSDDDIKKYFDRR